MGADGQLTGAAALWGMNALLEHWAMAIHPPTLFIGYGTLMLTAAAYFSIVMNGTVMAPLFRKRGYRPENCSRVVEDAGTLGGPLVPWASNALFPMSMLSVSYMDYAPWAFVLYLTPLMSILYAAFNINMTRLTPEEMAEENKEFVAE